jgi:hypothetical protein
VVYPKVWSAQITNHVVEWVMDIIGNFLMEVMEDSWGNHISKSRTWLLVFLEFECELWLLVKGERNEGRKQCIDEEEMIGWLFRCMDYWVYACSCWASHKGVTLTCEEEHLIIEECDTWWQAHRFFCCTWVVGADGVDQREREGDWQGMRDLLLKLDSFLSQRPFLV